MQMQFIIDIQERPCCITSGTTHIYVSLHLRRLPIDVRTKLASGPYRILIQTRYIIYCDLLLRSA